MVHRERGKTSGTEQVADDVTELPYGRLTTSWKNTKYHSTKVYTVCEKDYLEGDTV